MIFDPDYDRIEEKPANLQRGLRWVTAAGNRIPDDAIQGGVDENGQELYIARALCNNTLVPGKADPSKVHWVPLDRSNSVDQEGSLVYGGYDGTDKLYICRSDDDPKGQLGQCRLTPSKFMLFSLKRGVRFTTNFKRLEYTD
ncbi:hypothetical protein IW150_006880 [Coemansia sp. RSA 2607]|nr:hypothetical protein IW150_006880 [Coemansia sp. RSA 2607]